MISQKYVDAYIEAWKKGLIIFNQERIDLVNHLETEVLIRDDIYFDETQIEQCINYIEKWYFKLELFQKFIIAFLFLKYKRRDKLFYKDIVIVIARGNGKNGLISGLADYFISPGHGIEGYNVDVVANSEDQAQTSVKEVYNMKEKNKSFMKKFFSWTKTIIRGKETLSEFMFRTSNADTKDGGRPGCLIFDEWHIYEDTKLINTLSSGLGKVMHRRRIYISTNGHVRGGFFDKFIEQCLEVLRGGSKRKNRFVFICKMDDKEEVDKPELWEKANPMFSKPMSPYAEELFDTLMDEYLDLEDDPSGRPEFMAKRMNLPQEDNTVRIASWKDIEATNRPIPYERLKNKKCIGAIDYSFIKDFTACGVLFKDGEDYIWDSHQFARREFVKEANLKPPIFEWEEQGLITLLDEPVINIKHMVNYFCRMRDQYGLDTIIGDTFRLDIVKQALEDAGFHVLYIQNPHAIYAKLAPRIEMIFAQHRVIFGDNPIMRWNTNNIVVKVKNDGNKDFIKKDEVRRKTDGFSAFVYAMWQADQILEEEAEFFLGDIDF
ncbi:terminase large subunit (plasmid) [Cytobacillus spongiae]|uniref:terminase TerL endonuclease subunit n=1 Tax=Cytobacillus spongiae TaxID=2901381 RepID=UPI001F2D2426|nr:terminase TerL endonuclease subunit [Cytobacillus spongiae]UII58676.1 terminase large subunit [Cytobacillus spongiae]